MLPKRSLAAALLAWVLFWALMVLVAIEDFRRDGGTAIWQPVLWETSSALVASGLLLLQRRFTARHDVLISQPWRWAALQARWLPLYWIAFAPLAFGIRHLVYGWAGASYDHEPWGEVLVYEALKITVFVSLFTAVGFGLLSWRQLLDERVHVQRAQALLREAELARLTRQMQPHFLFNALNTVSSLMHVDVARADATLVRLADVLRAAMDLGARPQASLAEELRLARAYAAVMAERFEDRVALDWEIEDAAMHVSLPAVSLQPLLENVFRHTVERRREMTRVRVSAACREGELVLRVEDDGGRLDGEAAPGGQGVALANLRARLEALHGARAGFTLSALAPRGVRAEMRVPCVS
jgi:hypothetical protein